MITRLTIAVLKTAMRAIKEGVEPDDDLATLMQIAIDDVETQLPKETPDET